MTGWVERSETQQYSEFKNVGFRCALRQPTMNRRFGVDELFWWLSGACVYHQATLIFEGVL